MAKTIESRADLVESLSEIAGNKGLEATPRIQASRTLMDLMGWKKGDQSKNWEDTPQDELEAAAKLLIPQLLGQYFEVVS